MSAAMGEQYYLMQGTLTVIHYGHWRRLLITKKLFLPCDGGAMSSVHRDNKS